VVAQEAQVAAAQGAIALQMQPQVLLILEAVVVVGGQFQAQAAMAALAL